MSASVRIDASEYALLAKQIKDIDKKVYEELAKNIKRQGKYVVKAVRKAALQLPSSGGEAEVIKGKRRSAFGMGLRAALAGAVQSRIISKPNRNVFALRIKVSGSTFRQLSGVQPNGRPNRPRKLPRYVEGLGKNFQRWRYPVYGNREVWRQREAMPFLVPTADKYRPGVQAAVESAFDAALKRSGFK